MLRLPYRPSILSLREKKYQRNICYLAADFGGLTIIVKRVGHMALEMPDMSQNRLILLI